MNKELRLYKKSLQELLKGYNIKIKSLFPLVDGLGYRAFLKYKNLDLLQLNMKLKHDINKIFNCNDCKFNGRWSVNINYL